MEWDNESIIEQIQKGQENRDELIEKLWLDNLHLIRIIIHKLSGLQYGRPSDREDFEDLEQQAFLGIMDAIKHYDRAQGIKFFSFAQAYIRTSVYRYYDRAGQALRIPAYQRKRIRDYMGERDRLRENGEPATDEIIQEHLQLSDKAFDSTQKAVQRLDLQRLDSYLNESDKEAGTVLDMIAGSENVSESALAGSYASELHHLLRSALQELPEKEKQVLIARHYQRMNNRQIAGLLNCTPQYVSKMAKTAYKRIRTGKYGKELLEFLPERAMERQEKRIEREFKELTEQERDLLI